MLQQLFSQSWLDDFGARRTAAVADVARLERKFLLDPGLAGKLEKIASAHALNVATLADKAASASDRTMDLRGQYGDRMRGLKVLDVVINYTGDGASFNLAPRSGVVVQVIDYVIKPRHIVVTVEDGPSAKRVIEDFIRSANENLGRLRTEVAQYEGKILELVTKAAEKRIAGIKAEKERDDALGFPVTRRG